MVTPKFRMIAGRGSVGDINWGAAGRPLPVLEEELAELKKHIGQRVLLTGGGGGGGSMATLRDARIVQEGYVRGKPGLKVTLTNIDPKYGGYAPYPYRWVTLKSGKEVFRKVKPEPFDPWIDSWQISVPVGEEEAVQGKQAKYSVKSRARKSGRPRSASLGTTKRD